MSNSGIIKTTLGLICLLVLSIQSLHTQTNYLEHKVNISNPNASITEILEEISTTCGVKFSYNSELLDENKRVKIDQGSSSIAYVLDEISDGNLRYKVIGHHIVLLEKEKTIENKKQKKNKDLNQISIQGRIFDAKTKQTLENVSVYEIRSRQAEITGKTGEYKLFVSPGSQKIALNYSKTNYRDTIVFCDNKSDLELNVSMVPIPKEVPIFKPIEPPRTAPSSVSELELVKILVPHEAMINAENIKVFDSRPAQISFLPYLGSNAKVSGTMSNHISVNVLSGFTGSVDGVEIGTILNITKRHVKGIQLSGFGNITGDYLEGVQMSGFFNRITGKMYGFQASGFANLVSDTINGVQLSGFLNLGSGQAHGFQGAGFSNVVRNNFNGFQISGFNNYVHGETTGIQLSGFNNFSRKNIKGIQLSGFLNIASEDISIGQVAGFANYTGGINKGIQLAGFINMTDTLQGIQISVINVADTSAGLSLGFFNYIDKGYRSLQISYDEILPLNMSFRSGTDRFYNIYSLGFNPSACYPWAVGFGVGSRLNVGKKIFIAPELKARYINENEIWEKDLNLLSRFEIIFEYRLFKNIVFTAGPGYNVHISSLKYADSGDFNSDIAFYPFYEKSNQKTRVQMWIGGSVACKYVF